MYSNTTLGPASDPLANTTLEAPPSEPRGLIARDIRNTSVNLFWDPPEHFNGVLMDYQVWYNGDHNITTASRNASEKMNYHLTGLKPFITYKLLVKACTSKCSNSSNNVIIKTKVGDAGKI